MFSKSENNELRVILNPFRACGFNNSVDMVEKETSILMISAVA